MYKCKLIYKGYVKENFFRSGESAESVLTELQAFCYGKGHWHVSSDDEYAEGKA